MTQPGDPQDVSTAGARSPNPYPTASDPRPAAADPLPATSDPFPATSDPFPATSGPFPATSGQVPAASDPYTGSYDTPPTYLAASAPVPVPYQSGYPYVVPPQFGYVDPRAPYGIHPATGQPMSNRSKLVAGLLQLLPGLFFTLGGFGRLYSSHIGLGFAQIMLSVVAWVSFWCGFALFLPFFLWLAIWMWFILDGALLLARGGLDGKGRVLR
jgi:hypothetical protein